MSSSSCSLSSWSKKSWCICCSQGYKWSSWSDFCMSSPSPLHRLATQHYDERYKHKQSESFLSQLEHTIWVSRHRTLRIQYLHFECSSLKAVHNSCTLGRVAKFLFMYFFTPCLCTNIVFFQAPTCWNSHLHKRLLPDEVFLWR